MGNHIIGKFFLCPVIDVQLLRVYLQLNMALTQKMWPG